MWNFLRHEMIMKGKILSVNLLYPVYMELSTDIHLTMTAHLSLATELPDDLWLIYVGI